MLEPNFQLNRFLNDKRMQARYDWINSMTILLEKITESNESHEQILSIFEQLPGTLYLEGVYDEIGKIDSNTNQLRYEFIRLFLKIANKFLAIIPHSSDSLKKIFERIELQFIKNKSESRVRKKKGIYPIVLIFFQEFEGTKTILDEVLERVKAIENPKQRNENISNTTIENNLSQPFGDYRQLPIVPNVTEILSDRSVGLRKNIIDGSYDNAEQYLDVRLKINLIFLFNLCSI